MHVLQSVESLQSVQSVCSSGKDILQWNKNCGMMLSTLTSANKARFCFLRNNKTAKGIGCRWRERQAETRTSCCGVHRTFNQSFRYTYDLTSSIQVTLNNTKDWHQNTSGCLFKPTPNFNSESSNPNCCTAIVHVQQM